MGVISIRCFLGSHVKSSRGRERKSEFKVVAIPRGIITRGRSLSRGIRTRGRKPRHATRKRWNISKALREKLATREQHEHVKMICTSTFSNPKGSWKRKQLKISRNENYNNEPGGKSQKENTFFCSGSSRRLRKKLHIKLKMNSIKVPGAYLLLHHYWQQQREHLEGQSQQLGLQDG